MYLRTIADNPLSWIALQELLAPKTVLFVTEQWQVIGHKGAALPEYQRGYSHVYPLLGSNLDQIISNITGIPERVLQSYALSSGMEVREKIGRMNGRETTREEDHYYALYGILGVMIGANYG